jgi:predicted transposase YdaD
MTASSASRSARTPHAIGLLQACLPPDITARLHWDSLVRKPADFIDARLRGRYSDLLFSIRTIDTDEEVLVYALMEHQSTPHPLMVYRVLRYMVRIWDDHLKAHPRARRLPLIISVVIYHGSEPWKVARTFRDLLDAPRALLDAAAEHVPQFRFRFIDLQHRDADRLLADVLTAFGQAAVWAMKTAGDDEHVIEGLGRMSDVLGKMLAQPDGQAALGALLRYLLATHERLDQSKLARTVAETIAPHAGEKVVTVYEQLIEKGRKKGLKEGRAEGRAEGLAKGQAKLLLNQLAAKFGPVPAKVQARVKAAEVAELTAWGTRVLTAVTLAETLDSTPARQPVRRSARPRG